ncbi:hypothetical protein [Fischerella sp. JS2]|uniref:hypothetical protein n=1 Tax=Fischerella sp. JS2 TaxID=2597771 RepID=UPI0028EB3508|nr:hypothetical protein [Fischerella sp. JS2]
MTQPIFCPTPTRGLLNLVYARQIQFRKLHKNNQRRFACRITWSNGDKDIFVANDAQAIAQKLRQIT